MALAERLLRSQEDTSLLSLNFENDAEVQRVTNSLLVKSVDEEVNLTLSGLGWRLSETLSQRGALARVDQAKRLAKLSSVVVPFGRFLKKDQPVVKNQGTGWLKYRSSKNKDPLSRIFAYWEKTDGLLDPYFLTELHLEGLLPRVAMFAWEDSIGQLLYRHVGFQFEPTLGENWGDHLRDCPLYCSEPPDREYIHWVADQVNACFASEEPNRALVDAVIRSPYPNEIASRINDDRLMLPCHYPNGKPALVMVSQRAPGAMPLI